MGKLTYILKRLAFVPLVLFVIMLGTYAIVELAPGGPIDQAVAEYKGHGDVLGNITGGSSETAGGNGANAQGPGGSDAHGGIPPDIMEKIKERFGYDKPFWERFSDMMLSYIQFDFGSDFYEGRPVVDIVLEKLPASAILGVATTLIVYLISIPLGMWKARFHRRKLDRVTDFLIVGGQAIPAFLFALMLIVLFASGQYFDWFPLRGLWSSDFAEMSFGEQVMDIAHHGFLPILAMVIGAFAGLTTLVKNSFLDELGKTYVAVARAKGLPAWRVMFGHVFRNAMLIVIAGFPAAFIGMFFTGSLLIEVLFSIDGLGKLGYEAALSYNYPIMFGTLFCFTLLSLILQIVSDITYMLVDPRIDFGKRG